MQIFTHAMQLLIGERLPSTSLSAILPLVSRLQPITRISGDPFPILAHPPRGGVAKPQVRRLTRQPGYRRTGAGLPGNMVVFRKQGDHSVLGGVLSCR